MTHLDGSSFSRNISFTEIFDINRRKAQATALNLFLSLSLTVSHTSSSIILRIKYNNIGLNTNWCFWPLSIYHYFHSILFTKIIKNTLSFFLYKWFTFFFGGGAVYQSHYFNNLLSLFQLKIIFFILSLTIKE